MIPRSNESQSYQVKYKVLSTRKHTQLKKNGAHLGEHLFFRDARFQMKIMISSNDLYSTILLLGLQRDLIRPHENSVILNIFLFLKKGDSVETQLFLYNPGILVILFKDFIIMKRKKIQLVILGYKEVKSMKNDQH